MIVAVTGASGWVGAHIVAFLHERGITTRSLVRHAKAVNEWSIDLSNPSPEWTTYLRGCEALIHCAARVHIPENRGCIKSTVFAEINARGTQSLLDAAVAAGVSRFVFLSTVAVYDWSQPGPCSETGALRPETAYARSKLSGELAVMKSPLDWRICRLATVFGSGDHANFARLAQALRKGTFILPGGGIARKSVLPVDLAARVIVHAAIDDCWQREVVNVALDESPTLSEICRVFERTCRFRPARNLPLELMKPIASIGTFCGNLGFKMPFNESTLSKLTTNTVVNSRRLREGYSDCGISMSFEKALHRYAEYYRNC